MLHVLHAQLAVVCPILGVNTDGVITFDPSATAEQRAAAEQVLAAWTPEVRAAAVDAAAAMQRLGEIDLASIRALREYVAALPGAPRAIVDREAEAQAERVKLGGR